MKTKILVKKITPFMIGVTFIVLAFLLFTQCQKENSGIPGTILMKATSQNTGLKSGKIETLSGNINLNKAVVEIKNLRIEENSGDDNQNGDQSGNGKDEGNEKKSESETGDAGDLCLAGPYSLNISNDVASIGEVMVQPGTYKKVNFEFFAGTENDYHSIVLSGTFTNTQGVQVPFTLTSEFAETIQLPLAGTGIQVTSGSIATISIFFDVNNWLNKLDFNTASQNNGQININKDENSSLYQTFITEVTKNVEIEN